MRRTLLVLLRDTFWKALQEILPVDTLQQTVAIGDQAVLAEIVTRDPHPLVRRAAVARVSDQGLWRDIATRDSDKTVRAFAVAHLTDAVLVKQVSKTDSSNLVRQRAKARLAALRSRR